MRAGNAILAAVIVGAAAGPAAADAIARRLTDEGDALAARGDHAGALAKYEAALDADPDSAPPYQRAMPLWLEADALESAQHYLERGATRHPEWPSLWYSLAYIYRREHRTDVALEAYGQYILLRPSDPAPYFGIAVLQDEAGATDAAVSAYRRYRALEGDPTRADFRAQALRAIERLAPRPTTWPGNALRLLVDGGDAEAWRKVAATP